MSNSTVALAPPIYDINKSYLENSIYGPFFEGMIPIRHWPKQDQWIDFLGHRIASRVGIPAGPLLNSKWIGLSANLGFDVVCYKTIRSFEHLGHPVPNVIYVEPFDADHLPPQLRQLEQTPSDMESLAITNSFGMPSRSPSFLQQDIPLSNELLHPGQVMLVSVVGTPGRGDFVEDFVSTARFAKDCGAKIIEANFSCPNVATCEGDIANNPTSVYEIASQIVKAISPVPLVIKVGVFPNTKLMQETLCAAARAGARGISGINTISMKVVNAKGEPALGANRLTSGICGNPIRKAALQFIRGARSVIEKERLGLSLIGCGGITLPDHFQEFLDAGADVAMTATGMMWDPYIAYKFHQVNHEKN